MAQTGIMSNYLKNKLIDHLLRNTAFTAPTAPYLALFSVSPSDTRSGTEISAGGYSRQSVFFNVSGNTATNPNKITFPIATADWATVTAIAIMDAATSGNILFWGKMDNTVSISTGENFIVNSNMLNIELAGLRGGKGGWGDGVAEGILKHVLKNTTFTSPGTSVYLALGKDLITHSTYTNEFVSWTEVSEAAYSRKQVTSWYAPTTGSTCNLGTVVYGAPPIANIWGAITHMVVFDNAAVGNALLWGKLRNPVYIIDGDGLKIDPGDIDIWLD